MMQIKAVKKSYSDITIVDAKQLEIPRGKFTAFIGPNGAGKSTLLAMMSRLLPKDEGQIILKGEEVEAWEDSAFAQELTMLKQQTYYQTKFTVEELVAFGRFPYSKGRLSGQDYIKIEEAIHYMNLQEFRGRMIDTLSGGQLQRVFIAMVLAQDTEVILLDEPLNNLDIKQSISMMKTLRRLVDELGKTVVIVIHDINIASQFVDEMVALKDGQIFATGTPHELMVKETLDDLYDMDLTLGEINGKRICLYY